MKKALAALAVAVAIGCGTAAAQDPQTGPPDTRPDFGEGTSITTTTTAPDTPAAEPEPAPSGVLPYTG